MKGEKIMLKKVLVFTISMCMLLNIASFAVENNLVLNSGFETEEELTWGFKGVTLARSTDQHYSGDYSLLYTATENSSDITYETEVLPNTAYLGAIKSYAIKGRGVGFSVYSDDGTVLENNYSWRATTNGTFSIGNNGNRWESLDAVYVTGEVETGTLAYSMSAIGGDKPVAYLDDAYLAPLTMNGAISGSDSIIKTVPQTYTVEMKNQLGTQTGVGNDFVSADWSLKEDYTGVSINEYGVLEVTTYATAEEITLVAEVSHVHNSVAPVTLEKTVSVINTLVKNPNFDTDDVSAWSSSLGTNTETSYMNFTVDNGKLLVSSAGAKNTYAYMNVDGLTANTVYLAQAEITQTGANQPIDMGAQRNELLLKGSSTTTSATLDALYIPDGSTMNVSMVEWVTSAPGFYVDNIYFAPLTLKGELSGADRIFVGGSSDYTVDVTNQLGTKIGVEAFTGEGSVYKDTYAAPTVTLSLKDSYNGVSLENGKLTVSETASAGTVIVKAVISSPFKSYGVSDLIIEKEVKIINNYAPNPNFDTNDVSAWSSSLATNTETSYMNFTVDNGKLLVSSAGAKNTYAYMNVDGLTANTVYLAQAEITQTGANQPIDMGAQRNELLLKGSSTTTSATLDALYIPDGSTMNVSMVEWVTSAPGFYVDNIYFVPLKIKANVFGDDKILKGTSSEYTVDVTNQLGTKTGVEAFTGEGSVYKDTYSAPIVTLALKDSYSGVSLVDGVLTVSKDAALDSIVIVATVTSPLSTYGVEAVTVEKEIKLTDYPLSVTAVSTNEATISATVTNITDAMNATVIYAIYNGDKLVDCYFETKELTNGENPVSYTFDTSDYSQAKIFVFDSMNDLKPLSYMN